MEPIRIQRRSVLLFSLAAAISGCAPKQLVLNSSIGDIANAYIEKWAGFYPTRAYGEGRKASAGAFEVLSQERIAAWVRENEILSEKLAPFLTSPDVETQLDAAMLARQAKWEIELWTQADALSAEPELYSDFISQALTHLLVRDDLDAAEKAAAVSARLAGVKELCKIGLNQLKDANKERAQGALGVLRQTALFYRNGLPGIIAGWGLDGGGEKIQTAAREAAVSVDALADHIDANIIPSASSPVAYGAATYARRLEIYADGAVTPEELSALAAAEIDRVRAEMIEVSRRWRTQNGGGDSSTAGESDEAVLAAALAAMEDDRPASSAEMLEDFTTLTDKAEAFIREKGLATLPDPRTLYIAMSPAHLASVAFGGVYPTGPFSPQSDTLFLLPYVPDDAPARQKEGFYRSYNDHFNEMIISHEMFPGHYMQAKTGVLHAPAWRMLFGNDIYAEGWGSFSEILMLNAGWGGGDLLTRLAHLRKRIENATRAYVSVQVHTKDWNKGDVMNFATTRGLLAPQFAENLWDRVVNSPFQIITYFLGYHGFVELWESEQKRLGDGFSTRNFVDGVLRAGTAPVHRLAPLLK
ncbi:MAG: DUF885 family protein [Parvularculaceae bacterium]|nr:DUF885 family protein [Parvularculaceae bacterium]